MNLTTVKEASSWREASGAINENFAKMETEITKAVNATVKFRGYFTTSEKLNSAYPSPRTGECAWAGTPYPGTVYDVADGKWHNTGQAPSTQDIDLADYYTKDEMDTSMAEQDVKLAELSSGVDKVGNRSGNYSGSYPISESLKQKGVQDLIIDGYLDTEYVDGITHSISILNKEEMNMSIYTKPKDVSPSGNIKLFCTFEISKLDSSSFYIAKQIYGTGNSWFIIDLNSVESYSNAYDTSGIALNKRLYRGGEYEKTRKLENYITDIENNISELSIEQKKSKVELPYIDKEASDMDDETSNDITLTSELLSEILIDFKLSGTPEEGYEYKPRLQFNGAGAANYSNSLMLYKYKDGGSGELLCAIYLGTVPPTGKIVYRKDVSSQGTVTAVAFYINFDALPSLPDKNLTHIFRFESYKFKNDYLFNESLGPLYDYEEIQKGITDARDMAEEAYNMSKSIKESLEQGDIVLYEEKGEIEYYKKLNTGYTQYGVAQYTSPFSTSFSFNILKIGPVKCNAETQYFIYIKEKGSTTDNVPSGLPTSKSRFVAKGELGKSVEFTQYEIYLSQQTVNEGEQIVVYFYNKTSRSQILGLNGINNGELYEQGPNNRVLFITTPNSQNPESENWSKGAISYIAVAPVVMFVNNLVYKDDLKEEIGKLGKQLDEQVPALVNAMVVPDLKLTIPDTVPAVVGTELNIWNDTVTLSQDAGLQSPRNYQTFWYCSKGYVTQRGFRFTPSDSDARMVYNCKITLYDNLDNKITEKTFKIKVYEKTAIQSQKRILYVGDSLGISTSNEIQKNFEQAGGTPPIFVGTQGSTYKCEGYGGWKWENFATKGTPAFRIMVENVSSVSIGSVYKETTTSRVFKVEEVNVTEGAGNILLSKYSSSLGQYGDLPIPSGNLTKVEGDGDSQIAYTGAYEESSNPFWDDSTGALNIQKYRTEKLKLAENEKIDLVAFTLGINGSSVISTPDTVISQIKTLYNAFISDNPNCIFAVGLTPTCGNTIDGAGSNYGATWDQFSYIRNMYKFRLLYLELLSDVDMPNLRIAPVNLWIDRYYGYNFSSLPISARYTETEKRHSNHVHPGNSGYQQLGDGWFASIIQMLAP